MVHVDVASFARTPVCACLGRVRSGAQAQASQRVADVARLGESGWYGQCRGRSRAGRMATPLPMLGVPVYDGRSLFGARRGLN